MQHKSEGSFVLLYSRFKKIGLPHLKQWLQDSTPIFFEHTINIIVGKYFTDW
jgi:hypothetical protein